MNWLESGDMANRQVSLAGHQVHVDDDGRLRVVLSAQDPGVPNWIDTEGRPSGLVYWRFLLPEGEIETPRARVVALSELRG